MLVRLGITLLAAGMLTTTAFSAELQDWDIVVDSGSGAVNYCPSCGDTFSSVPDLDSSGFNSATGEGTLTFTITTPGTYYIGGEFFDPVATPFYNEYGVVNGSPASGQSWQIDVPEYDESSPNLGSGTIVDNLIAESLDDANTVPGTTDNYLLNCGAYGGGAVNTNCNDFVGLAEAFAFTVTSGNEELVTFDLSGTNPGGFSVEDVHPVDGANTTAAAVYLSGSATSGCLDCCVDCCIDNCSPVPEPSYISFAGIGLLFSALVIRKRLVKKA